MLSESNLEKYTDVLLRELAKAGKARGKRRLLFRFKADIRLTH